MAARFALRAVTRAGAGLALGAAGASALLYADFARTVEPPTWAAAGRGTEPPPRRAPPAPPLSDTQLEAFQRDGYVVVRGMLDKE